MRTLSIVLGVYGLFSLALGLKPSLHFPEPRMKASESKAGAGSATARISHRIESDYSRPVEVGSSLDLWCSFDESPQSCGWINPSGMRYTVEGSTITDENGEVVDTIVVNATSSQDCHIQILSLDNAQIGDWSCNLGLGAGSPFQRSTLAVTDKIRIQDVRLPQSLKPETYSVFLTPYIIPDNFTIDGRVEITMEVTEATDVIRIHAKDMTIHEDTVMIDASADLIIGFGNDLAREFFIIYLSQPLTFGSTMKLDMEFLGNLNDQLAGFYRSQYQSAEGEVQYMAVTQFESTDARRAFPCFDEPAMKAKFQIQLGRVPAMTSISNMPIKTLGLPMDSTDEYVWDVYEETVIMSTYLLAFVVSDFTFRKSDPLPNNVDFKIWSRESAFDRTDYAAQVGPAILAFYEDYFGVGFPLPKQDMIAIPDFSAGAMENWGLITYRETALLYDPAVSSPNDRVYVANVIAHELAHQWFGNLVTMKWWSDLWLNEGFASYTEYIGTNHVEPDAAFNDRFVLESMYSTFALDALESSHPISVDVNHPDEINEAFDGISYGKGASVIRMMANFLGLDTFNKGISNYLNKYQYSNAEQDDLWNEITTAALADGALEADLTIKDIMDTWTLQEGFPVVTVSVLASEGKLTMEQARFLISQPDAQASKQPADFKWWVPISYTKAGGDFSDTRNQFWLKPSDTGPVTEVADVSEGDAVILNVQETGFYRVNYDSANWNRIAQALESNYEDIHRVNRAQILDDVFNLAKVGLLNYEDALAQTKYLTSETDFIPWSAGLSGFSYIKSMFKREAKYGDLKIYLNQTLTPIYTALSYNPQPDTDSFLDGELRAKIVSSMCNLENRDCTAQSVAQFQAWMASSDPDSSNPVDTATKSTAYCTALGVGTELEWNFLWERYLNSDDATEQSTILSALGCTKEIWLLQKYLDMVLEDDSPIRTQDSSRVVSSVARNVVGRDLAWNWVRTNWDRILEVFDTAISSSVGTFVSSCAAEFNQPQQLAELVQFYEDQSDTLGTAKSTVANAIQSTKANIAWMEQYFQAIADWLADQLSNGDPQ